MPSPQPSPTGEGADCSRFCGCRRFEKQLGFTTVDCRSSEKQKAACTTCFPCRTLNPQQPPRPLSRGRELERGQQAARLVFGRLGCWERLPKFGACPLPSPPPRGEGEGCSRFRRCRSSEKECPKYQQQEFFRQPLSQGRWNKRRERFFRRPLNPSVGRVPQGTHAVGWDCREHGERVRAYRIHLTCGLRLATLAYF